MKASDLFVRCLEAEGVTHIFGVPGERRERGRDDLADGQSHPLRPLPPRAGRRLRRRRLRAAHREGGGVPRHPRSGGHQSRHRCRRRQHGPVAARVHHRAGQHPAPAQGEPPEHGLGRHVRADHQVGAHDMGCGHGARGGAQGVQDRRGREARCDPHRASRGRGQGGERRASDGRGQDPPAGRRSQGGAARRRPHRRSDAADRAGRQRRSAQARRPPAPALRPQDRHRGRQHLHGQGRGADVGPPLPVHHGASEPRLHQPRARRGRPGDQRRLRPRGVCAELLEPRPVDPDHPHRLRSGRDRQPLSRGARHPGRHRRRPVADQRGAQPSGSTTRVACRCSTSGSGGSSATPSATTSRWRRTTRASP